MTADYSSDTMEVKRKWHDIFKCLKKGELYTHTHTYYLLFIIFI